MLTLDMLRANTTLAGLSDEQLAAIATMSQNDENAVIANKVGVLHGQYDADILATTGVAKNEGEKTFNYMKRVLTQFKTAADGQQTYINEINSLKAEKAQLEQKLADGSADAALKQKLADTETRLSQMQAQYNSDKESFAKEKKGYEDKIKSIKVDFAFDKAFSGLTFKDGVDDSVKTVLMQDAKRKVLAKGKPDFVDINGVSTLVFRDANGATINNPSNNLQPYTALELLQGVDSLKSILGTGQRGGGTEPIPPRSVTLDLTGVKTQVEADEVIAKHLMDKGLTRYSSEFTTEAQKLRANLGVDKLPIR